MSIKIVIDGVLSDGCTGILNHQNQSAKSMSRDLMGKTVSAEPITINGVDYQIVNGETSEDFDGGFQSVFIIEKLERVSR